MAATFRMQLLRPARLSPLTPTNLSLRSKSISSVRAAFAYNSCWPSSTTRKRPPQRQLFHTSARKSILPALPQRIEGTTNQPVPIREPNPTHGSYHWTFERLIAAGLVPLTIAPFAAGSLNPLMDAILCGTMILHSHIGFQSVIIDYIPAKRLPRIRKLFWWGLNAGTILVGVGLYQFETNDVGVTEAIKRIWVA